MSGEGEALSPILLEAFSVFQNPEAPHEQLVGICWDGIFASP